MSHAETRCARDEVVGLPERSEPEGPRDAESAKKARNLANTMNYASILLEAKHHLNGETTNCSGHCDKTTNLQFSQHSLPLCASA